MKKVCLLILCSFYAATGFSQITYGVAAGAGISPAMHADVQPAISVFAMKKLHTNVSYGCSLIYQNFFADEKFSDDYGHTGETVEEVSHRYSFIFVMPAVDFGLGKHKYIHLDIDLGPGFSLQARNYTTKYTAVTYSPTGQFYRALLPQPRGRRLVLKPSGGVLAYRSACSQSICSLVLFRRSSTCCPTGI